MTHARQALIVARNPKVGNALIAWLSASGFEIVLVTTFEAARRQLAAGRPHVLVTEVKLGEHNGLHLVLQARGSGIPAIVLGLQDPVLERDAIEFGASYYRLLPARADLLQRIEQVVDREDKAFGVDPALWVVPPDTGGHTRHVVH